MCREVRAPRPCHFNSRPSARGDGRRRCTPQSPRYFNSRPSARGDFPGVRESGRRENFNSRPSARGDSASRSSLWHHDNFNSRPSARGDVKSQTFGIEIEIFQFTPLREGRRGAGRIAAPMSKDFNSRPSARGDTVDFTIDTDATIFQFTPLREGRPHGYNILCHTAYFNSRPSARGDCRGLYFLYRPPISIHAPPRGATVAVHATIFFNAFQFTPLREGRRVSFSAFCVGLKISIHAPPRGATLCGNL